jgi:hypothetical protein
MPNSRDRLIRRASSPYPAGAALSLCEFGKQLMRLGLDTGSVQWPYRRDLAAEACAVERQLGSAVVVRFAAAVDRLAHDPSGRLGRGRRTGWPVRPRLVRPPCAPALLRLKGPMELLLLLYPLMPIPTRLPECYRFAGEGSSCGVRVFWSATCESTAELASGAELTFLHQVRRASPRETTWIEPAAQLAFLQSAITPDQSTRVKFWHRRCSSAWY